MVELCGREVVKHDLEEHEDVQVSLAVENIGVDVREKTKRLSACCDRTPTDQDCEIPSRSNISHASRAEPFSLFEKQTNGSSGVGVVKAVYPNPINEKYNGDCHKEALALLVHDMPLKLEVHELNSSKERNASMEDSLLEVIDNQAEAAICSQTDILDGIMSLNFHIQDDGTKQSGVHVESSQSSLSLTALDDSPEQPKLEVKSSPSLKNEVWVGYPGSSMDTTHPQDGDTTLKMLDCDDIHNSYHYYHGPRDSRIMSLTSLDETNEFSVASIRQMPHLEHCGRSYKASLVDYIAGNSSEHVLWKDEINVFDTWNEKGRELQMLRNPSSVYGRSQNVLKGLYNIPIDSFVEKSAADLSPLAVEVAPSAHLTNDITVCSSSDLISCCARQVREQPIHASLSQGAVAEFKHMSNMRNTRTHQSRKEVKNEMVVKRGRRSSKAVKYDECMKSFGVVSRKKRSYFTKPAGSYAWWSSGTVLRSPKNIIVSGDIKKESWIECGYNKSRKVGKRKETVSMVFHDKAGTTSTCVRLKVKSKAADQNCLTAAVPKIYGCSPPHTADSAIGRINECSGQVKGGCSMKYTKRHERNWPVQVDDAYLNSHQADTFPVALKLDADDSSKSLGDITDDVTGNAAKVYLATSLQEEVKAVEENGGIIEDMTRNAAKVHLSTSLLGDVIAVEENVENKYLDPETSPDSEVIDVIPEVGLAGRAEDNLLNSVPLTSTCLSGIQGGITSINFTYSSRKKGRKKEMSTLGGDCLLNSSSGPVVSGESKQMGSCTSLSKIKNIYVYDKSLPSLEISETHTFPKMSCSGLIDNDCDEPSQTLVSLEKKNDPGSGVSPVLSATIVAGHITSQSWSSSCFVPDQKLDKAANTSLSIEMTKITSGSGVLDSGCKGINILEHDPLQIKMVSEIMETCATDQLYLLGNYSAPEDAYISDKLGMLDTAAPKAWACCDNCGKWRRIPSSLADYIKRTDCRWTCSDNMDRAFADCSIPQEKSDQAINQELQLSDCDEDVNELSDVQELKRRHSKAPGRERWTPIKTNSYLHRRRKNQTIDEIMVCHCKPPCDGGLGCGEECLNRMLNIECVRGTCPCEDHCSNQQFQERKYAKLKSFKSGKKGYGLCSEEDIGRGQFLIEYVGEVLDMPAYEARQKDYASKGHKHFYFMTLNGSEVS